jgi:hypothetical protein
MVQTERFDQRVIGLCGMDDQFLFDPIISSITAVNAALSQAQHYADLFFEACEVGEG